MWDEVGLYEYICCIIYLQTSIAGMRTLLRSSVPLLRILRPQPVARSLPPGSRAKYTDHVRTRLVLSGILSWLGLRQESEPENDLVITIKRGIIAAQVLPFSILTADRSVGFCSMFRPYQL